MVNLSRFWLLFDILRNSYLVFFGGSKACGLLLLVASVLHLGKKQLIFLFNFGFLSLRCSPSPEWCLQYLRTSPTTLGGLFDTKSLIRTPPFKVKPLIRKRLWNVDTFRVRTMCDMVNICAIWYMMDGTLLIALIN